MRQVIPTDVYDKDGNLTRIDFYNDVKSDLHNL